MKKRRFVAIGAVVGIGLFVAVFLYRQGGDAGSRDPGASPDVVDGMQAKNRITFRKALDEFNARLQEARASMRSTPSADEALQLRVKVLKEAFLKMHDANRMLGRDELRAQIMDSLLAEPGYLKVVTDVVVDWRYAESLFGSEQALARVSSIEVVKRAAERGDSAPIETAMSKLGDTLNAQQTWEKGIQHDYTDLIAGYINTLDTDKFLDNPQHFFELVKLTERTSNEIAKGLYDSKMRAISKEVLRERLGRYFASTAGASSQKL